MLAWHSKTILWLVHDHKFARIPVQVSNCPIRGPFLNILVCLLYNSSYMYCKNSFSLQLRFHKLVYNLKL